MARPLCFGKHIGTGLLAAFLTLGCGRQPALIVATTTSLQDTGLLEELVPAFQARTGCRVKTIAVGSGQALALAARGEVDVVLSHSPHRERELLAQGLLVERREVMVNEFWLAGPPADPAGAASLPVGEGMAAVAARGALFFSRGDDSGTHAMELTLWRQAGIQAEGPWYRATGQGMAATLRVAAEKGAYTLTDSATFLALEAGLGLVRLDGSPEPPLNVYSVLLPNPDRHPRVNAAGGREFARFLSSEEARAIVVASGLFRVIAGGGE